MAFIALSTDLQSLAISFVCWHCWIDRIDWLGGGGRKGYVSIAFYLIFSSKMWCVAGFLGRRYYCCYCWTSWHVQIGHLPIYRALSLVFFVFSPLFFASTFFPIVQLTNARILYSTLFSLSTSFYSHKTFSISWQFHENNF